MGNIFSGSEIVEIAVQIEKNGRDFYRTVAQHVKQENLKQTFDFLAKEEERHIEVFERILDRVGRYEPQGAFSDEYFLYMRALAKEHIFTQENKGKVVAQKIGSAKEAIEAGIGFEKESIIFYEGIKKVVPDYDHHLVEELINQEKAHLLKLWEIKEGFS